MNHEANLENSKGANAAVSAKLEKKKLQPPEKLRKEEPNKKSKKGLVAMAPTQNRARPRG